MRPALSSSPARLLLLGAAAWLAALLAGVPAAAAAGDPIPLRTPTPVTAAGFRSHGSCPGVPVDRDGWHFALPTGSGAFALLTVVFDSGTQTITSPGGRHAYLSSRAGSRLLSATAVATGDATLFKLRWTCPAGGGAPDGQRPDTGTGGSGTDPDASPDPEPGVGSGGGAPGNSGSGSGVPAGSGGGPAGSGGSGGPAAGAAGAGTPALAGATSTAAATAPALTPAAARAPDRAGAGRPGPVPGGEPTFWAASPPAGPDPAPDDGGRGGFLTPMQSLAVICAGLLLAFGVIAYRILSNAEQDDGGVTTA